MTTQLFDKINISRKISNHLIGKNHTHTHRISIGFMIMFFGVLLVKAMYMYDLILMHIIGEVVGFAIHAVGVMPIIERIMDLNSLES